MDIEDNRMNPYLSPDERELLQYYRLANYFNKEKTESFLRSLGISDEDEVKKTNKSGVE